MSFLRVFYKMIFNNKFGFILETSLFLYFFQLKKEPKRSRSSASEATLKSPHPVKMPQRSGQDNPAQKTGPELSGLLSGDPDVDV
jgi:hypothetical protein